MLRYSFLILALSLSFCSYAGDGNYAVGAIPEALLKNANVVKRMEEVRFELINTGETVLYKKYALTILNEAGDRYATFYEWYDKLRKIQSVEGALYDMNGRQLKKVRNKEIQDISGTDDNNLIDDNRLKRHDFYYRVYPYTVEYEVEVKYNNSFMFPYWMPQEFQHLSVESSRFTVIVPESYEFRYKSVNYKGEPAMATEKGKKKMVWQVAAMAAIKKEFASPKWSELTPTVYCAPSEFELGNYKGNMKDWKEYGKFIYELNKGRDVLPDDIAQKVKELTAGLSTDKEKIQALYQFLQRHTRYISIQLGIGGWQPFEAAYVAKKGYGDCKALSNYMYSLLKAAGIKSYYALVSAGDDAKNHQMMTDFPSSQFNHVILCVPLKNDSVWLECTSQSMPAGYMGDFTGNRQALLIDEEGGKVVATPRYQLKENLQIRSVKGVVEKDGSLEIKVQTTYRGMQQDDIHSMLTHLSKEKVKKILNEQLHLSTYDVNDFKYQQKLSTTPEIEEVLDIYVSGYATVSGKRLFITPNLLNRSSLRVPDEERIHDFVFDYEYRDVDTVEIDIPEGYALEAAPQDVSLKTKFGTYNSSVKLVGNKLYYLRVREHYAGRYPAKDKEELSKFFEAIYKADRSRVVLVKKGE